MVAGGDPAKPSGVPRMRGGGWAKRESPRKPGSLHIRAPEGLRKNEQLLDEEEANATGLEIGNRLAVIAGS